jgi:peroxiredoxin Q/BCP
VSGKAKALALRARLGPGDPAPDLALSGIDGVRFDRGALAGRRHLISFYRFATCPFCNLRLHCVIVRSAAFGPAFGVAAVFDSPLDHLTRHAAGHRAPFPILADETGDAYRTWRVERSFLGMLKGMILRMPTLLRGLFAGYFPFPPRGSMLTMPADFLVDETGIIRVAYYGADEGDHLPLEVIEAFARGEG